jgi:hypothetical protein
MTSDPYRLVFNLHSETLLGNHFKMTKKDKESDLDDYEKLKNEIVRDRVNAISFHYPNKSVDF